ncbi:MAG: FtsW/RodA/SpoVE family cell cycle protein [Ignavibacteriae bacterium]|nr:FtsW/RodA/SpoVE family cell cycle protein [Ignavibacteriota bacterium]
MFRRNRVDLTLLISVLTLMFMSIAIVYSASAAWAVKSYGGSEDMLIKHAGKVAVGLVMIMLGMTIDYKRLKHLSTLGMIAAIILLCTTLIAGVVSKGAVRSFLGIQPSEFAKFALIFHLSALAVTYKENIRVFKDGFIKMLGWILAVTTLVMLQPNFSMGALIFGLGILMLFLTRAKVTHLCSMFLLIIPAIGFYMWSAEYRKRRILDFFFGVSTGESSYQLTQSKIAFGVGGIFGVGPGDSHQRDFFLPESYGDFVYAIIGEEYGMIGTIAVLVLFIIIMYRGMKIAQAAEDMFGRYLALGITSVVTLFAIVNAGVSVGMFPTTGLPMPFVSYGGSSMIFTTFAAGVLLNISSQTNLFPRERETVVVVPEQTNGTAVGKVY